MGGCTCVSGRTQGTLHAPGISVQTAALSVRGLLVRTKWIDAHHISDLLPADVPIVYLLRFTLVCKHTHCYHITLISLVYFLTNIRMKVLQHMEFKIENTRHPQSGGEEVLKKCIKVKIKRLNGSDEE